MAWPSRRLAAVWLVLAALVAVIAGLEYLDRRSAGSGAAPDPRALLAAPLDELGAIEIADRGRLHRFERDPGGAWFYHGVHGAATDAHTHDSDPALADRIERSFAAFARARVEREFPLDRDSSAYGVANPDVVILTYRRGQSQPLTQYAVGHVAPDTVSRYVMVVGRPVVVTIPKFQIDNLLELVEAAVATDGSRPGPTPASR
jgi:Domain of unknown function (DUF4340)